MTDNVKAVRPRRKINIIMLIVCAVLVAGLIAGDVVCWYFFDEINNHLVGMGVQVDADKATEALAEGDALVQKIEEEGIVLLENNGALPIKTNGSYNVNVFGTGGTDDGFSYTSDRGSAVATILPEDTEKFKKTRVTLTEGLEASGFRVNDGLLAEYEDGNPDASFYAGGSVLDAARSWSDTAIVVISRITGENASASELLDPAFADGSLWLNDEERAMLDYVRTTYGTVIVIINSSNTMEMGFTELEGVDAALSVGYVGQSGTKAIGRVLSGAVTPSGHLAATAPYDTTQDPTYANAVRTGGGDNQIHYTENIYVGYKWYETAFAEKFAFSSGNYDFDFSTEDGYREVVQYPFGYGLSYTSFEWELGDVTFTVDGYSEPLPADGTLFDRDTTVSVDVTVSNTGNYPGKDVVQLYFAAPYYEGEIEKSAINLAAFAKTDTLYPLGYDVPDGEDAANYPNSQTLTLTFDIYDMASYDCYDKNGNGFKGWELDPGDYAVKLMHNAHDASEISDVVIKVPVTDEDTGRGYIYRFDPDTNGYVKNRFTGDDAEAGVPIDGSAFGEEVKYLTRSDLAGSFPTTKTPNRPAGSLTSAHEWYYTGWDDDPSLVRPELGRTEGEMLHLYTREDGTPATAAELSGTQGTKLVANEQLIMTLGANYDAPEWKTLLTQLTMDEINLITGSAGFGTKEAASIGKPRLLDFDGPSGFNSKITQSSSDTAWTGYPAASVLAQTWNVELAYEMGFALGAEAKVTGGMTGIYAPTVNLHRTPYNTRNYEAYGEDPVISGYMAANMITGARNNGLTCWLKHFALSEAGWNPNYVDTWLTEQDLRENYLKPFEIAVKDADANAVMSAFNRVGAVDCVNSYALLTKVLRDEWKFEGAVVTDYNMGELRKHIRSGNDLHLTPNENTPQTLDELNDVDVYCGVTGVKNALFTYCNTYYAAKTFDPDAEMTLATFDEPFAWWVLLLVILNVLAVLGLGYNVFRMFRPRRSKEKNPSPDDE